MDDLFNEVNDFSLDDSPPEKISSILQFFHDVQHDYEPAIFIVNVGVIEGFFCNIFNTLSHILSTKNRFSDFDFLGEDFINRTASVLTVDKETAKIVLNPKHLSRGKYNNNCFEIEVVNQTEETDRIIEFVMTNQFNFRSYVKTVSEKVKFSYSTRRETINNRRVNQMITSVGDDFVLTESVRDKDSPWLTKRKIIKFKILVDGEKCISGGRPGIPGSIYLTLADRTSMILFKKGTCLIVGSKIGQKRTVHEFVKKTLYNIYFLINIFYNFGLSKFHQEARNITIHKCLDCKDPSVECDNCLKTTAVLNELSRNREDNVIIEYLRHYNYMFKSLAQEHDFLISLCMELERSEDETLRVIQRLDNHIKANPDGLLSVAKIAVFGLKKKEMINSGLYLQMPASHKKHISMFNGNRITYRSLKKTEHAEKLINLYDKILDSIRDEKKSVGNVFCCSNDELYDLVDHFCCLFKKEDATVSINSSNASS